MKILLLILFLSMITCDFGAQTLGNRYLESKDVIGAWDRVTEVPVLIGGTQFFEKDTTTYRIGLDSIAVYLDYSHEYRKPLSFYVVKEKQDERGYVYEPQEGFEEYDYDLECSSLNYKLVITYPDNIYDDLILSMPIADSLWVIRGGEKFGLKKRR